MLHNVFFLFPISLLIFFLLSPTNAQPQTLINRPFGGVNRNMLTKVLSQKDENTRENINLPNYSYQTIPAEFDARTRWKKCKSLKRVRDQGNCYSGWAAAVAMMLSSRVCIANDGKKEFEISVEDLVTCCDDCWGNSDYKCSSDGHPFKAVEYWIEHGLVTGGELNSARGCKPTSSATYHTAKPPECSEYCSNHNYSISCSDGKSFGKGAALLRSPYDMKQLQTEIMKFGPVVASMKFSMTFRNYTGGVFLDDSGSYYYYDEDEMGEIPEYHAVVILGWEVENEVQYWLGANTWGNQWGENGFFKILKGENFLDIESEITVGYTDLEAGGSGSGRGGASPWLVFQMLLLICVIGYK